MSVLLESPFGDDHPFTTYIGNLRAGTSVSWFSESADINTLRDYLWGVMNLRHENTRHSLEGFAQTSAATVLFTAATSPRGSILTCFPLNDIGLERINNAVSDEWEATRKALSTGTYVGNAASAKYAAIDHGSVHPDFEGSDVFDYINGATIARLDG